MSMTRAAPRHVFALVCRRRLERLERGSILHECLVVGSEAAGTHVQSLGLAVSYDGGPLYINEPLGPSALFRVTDVIAGLDGLVTG